MIIACHRKSILQVRIRVSSQYCQQFNSEIGITELNKGQATAYILQNVGFISDRSQCTSQLPHLNFKARGKKKRNKQHVQVLKGTENVK